MSFETKTYRIRGIKPHLMHNGRLANPLDEISKKIKEVSGKRKKTDADFEEMARLEYIGGLYYDEKLGPYAPGRNIKAMLVKAARKLSKGKDVEAGVFIDEDFPLIYDGPRDPKKLWKDPDFRLVAKARVGQASVMRTRPQFLDWELGFEVKFDPNMLNERALDDIMEIAGKYIGFSDWRPENGRFLVL